MEIELNGDSKILLKPGLKTEIGRGSGITTNDRRVSRHHVSFELPLTSDEPKVRFEVIGRNPIWVQDLKSGKVNTFRSCQSGEMEAGDKFCVSAKYPVWFTVKRVDFGGKRELNGVKEVDLEDSLESRCEIIDGNDLEPEFVDISDIDPVKEFGFLVMGHEFDRYPKKMIKDMKVWDWFIEEHVEESEDDEFQNRRKRGRRKRKKGDENDDEEWTGESEEDKEQITSTKKVPRPKYSTRSKDRAKPGKKAHLISKGTVTDVKTTDEDEEDEDDETLGGFIVDELDNEEDIDNNEDEDEEEEEFQEDNDEEDE